MRIAQVAPLEESVPPRLYGGTERIVSYLTEELVRLGHEVTLFASGDSVTKARLVAPCPRSLRLDGNCQEPLAHHILLLDYVYRYLREFDIIHFHLDYIHLPLFRRSSAMFLTTLHGRLDKRDIYQLYKELGGSPFVSISNGQREPLPWLNWVGTVYHGLPEELYTPRFERGDYLAFLGRISPHKRPDRAIRIAEMAGMPLKMAAKIDDKDYHEAVVRPLLNSRYVEFVGEVNEKEKNELLGSAYALLFPIDWPEPFGLVMIEALACATPVIAWPGGSVPEVIQDGVNGFIVNNLRAATVAVENIKTVSRMRCRRTFEERFSAKRMTQDYVKIYQQLLAEREYLPRAM